MELTKTQRKMMSIYQKLLQDLELTKFRKQKVRNNLEAEKASFKKYSIAKLSDFKVNKKNFKKLPLSMMKRLDRILL